MLCLSSERGRNEFVGEEGKAKYVKKVSASLPLTLETIFGGTFPAEPFTYPWLTLRREQTCQLHLQVST